MVKRLSVSEKHDSPVLMLHAASANKGPNGVDIHAGST
jgi:hypothetical protein